MVSRYADETVGYVIIEALILVLTHTPNWPHYWY